MANAAKVVLVAERAVDWESWLDPLRTAAPAVRVIAQRPTEAASAFAARVRAVLQRDGAAVDDAVLVGGPLCDPEVLAARVLVVRALTSRMPAGGRLRLDGAGRARLSMDALAQIVSDQLQASGVSVVTERAPELAPALPLAA